MFELTINQETLLEAWQIICTQFPLAIWETVYEIGRASCRERVCLYV